MVCNAITCDMKKAGCAILVYIDDYTGVVLSSDAQHHFQQLYLI